MSIRPPSGVQFHISAGRWTAVATEVGAALRLLAVGGRALVDGSPDEAMATGFRGATLIPWPNRIADGRYVFAGAAHQLPIDRVKEHTAIHGLVARQAWRVLRKERSAVTLALDLEPRPGYPFSLACLVEYALDEMGLRVTTRMTNTGAGPLPVGGGHHPYFLPRTTLADARLRLAAERVLIPDARALPVEETSVAGTRFDLRAGVAIGTSQFDHCFGGFARGTDGRARIELDDIVIWMDPGLEWVQLYSGDNLPDLERRRSLAIEPMSCPPNAFNSGRDLRVLDPRESMLLRWGVELG